LKYPDVPAGCLLPEFLTLQQSDTNRTDDTRRVYGKININIAPFDVLRRLPFPRTEALSPAKTQVINGAHNVYNVVLPDSATLANNVAGYIIAYRDMTGPYANRAAASAITNLRSSVPIKGFLTPGELAVPLGDYMNDRIASAAFAKTWIQLAPGQKDELLKSADYHTVRDFLYNAVSNVVCVNSDTFAVTICVRAIPAGAIGQPIDWHYVAVIDAGACKLAGQQPAVLLFTEVK
jgi:hypothetical protein